MTKLATTLGIGRNTLLGFLREFGILNFDSKPNKEYIGMGWFIIIRGAVRVTKKGVEAIRGLLAEKGWPNIDNKEIPTIWRNCYN